MHHSNFGDQCRTWVKTGCPRNVLGGPLYLKEPTSIAGTFAAGQCQLPP